VWKTAVRGRVDGLSPGVDSVEVTVGRLEIRLDPEDGSQLT